MSRRDRLNVFIIAFLLIAGTAFCAVVNAEPTEQLRTPIDGCTYMRATGYIDQGMCADGIHHTRRGICAMAKEYIGQTAFVFEVNDDGSVGVLIGIYEIFDTGYGRYDFETGMGTIQAGKCIDIWFENKDDIKEFNRTHGDYVYVKVVDGGVG